MGEAFWAITLSIIVLRWAMKRSAKKREIRQSTQEEDDELITVIIPTIKGGK